jgi:hypothetical protein
VYSYAIVQVLLMQPASAEHCALGGGLATGGLGEGCRAGEGLGRAGDGLGEGKGLAGGSKGPIL